jgi:2-amino-4-hydroxy-6-hydroxymethyldihydropteridine diphosphokinase
MNRVWIGLGGNVGDVAKTLAAAQQALTEVAQGPLLSSPLYRSAPWGDVAQACFVNQVIGMIPRLGPEATLSALQEIERAHGRDRERETRWGPRTLDLDLLCWPGITRETARLRLPHPRLAERRFVLAPWASVAPDLVPYGLEHTVAALLAVCSDASWVRRL